MSLLAITSAADNRAKALAKRWASELADGKTGGAFGMNLFDVTGYSNETEAAINAYHNARDPGETQYAYNPNLWCADLLSQLSCLVIHKDDCGTGEGAVGQAWRARYGGVAVTPQHILYCGHAFTHAAGTWPGNTGITAPTRIRFIGDDGVTVDRVQIHQATALANYGGSNPNAANDNGADTADMTIAVLDSPLPSEVYIPKVLPSDYLYQWANYESIALSQEWQPQGASVQWNPYVRPSDYPQYNRQMVHILTGGPNNDFAYNVWPGDSGTPAFVQHRGELCVAGMVGADWAYVHPRSLSWAGRMNALIELADAAAVAMERIAVPTGYTVTEIDA